jgi:Protein of unknown function (DUF1559)
VATNLPSDNPYETPIASNTKLKSSLLRLGLRVALVCAIVLAFVALLLPFRRDARPASRRMQCSNNMRQLGLALLDYEQRYGEFPPAYTIDANRNRLHSWRTLLLPFLEGKTLYEDLDLTKPWDHPNNDRIREASFKEFECLRVFACPASKLPVGYTTYVAVVAPGSCLQPGKGRKISEITDGLENTIVIYETDLDQAVHWMSPEDGSLESLLQSNPKTKLAHSGHHALHADCSSEWIDQHSDRATLRAHLTIDGGESVSPGDE